MNPTTLLKHFDRISEAPNGIPRLRRFILDLAVRGKLVEQDPEDVDFSQPDRVPASELLKRIKQEKERLGKKDKPLPPISPNEVPFLVPNGWEWVRLGNVIHLISGQHLQLNEYSDQKQSGLPYVTGPSDFGENGLVITRYATVIKAVAKKGQILLTVKGSGVGKTIVCDLPEVAISRQLMSMNSIFWSNQFLVLITHRLAIALKENARSLIPGISREDVNDFIFGLPPLAEQHRIVAKVDELMAICDQLEAAQKARESKRDQLVKSTLFKISQTEPTRSDIKFFLKHIPVITTRPEHIQQLRQTILNLAVRGKLVEQDPNEEPAAELLKRIKQEKERLGNKDKSLPPISPAEVPFLVPNGWEWVQWDSIALKIGDIDHKMPETVKNGVPYISPRDFLPRNGIDFNNAKNVSIDDFIRLSAKIKPMIGDLIYPRYGTIGENRLVTVDRDFLVSYSCAVIKVLQGYINPNFQYIYSISSCCKEQAKAAENKATQANVGIKSIQEFLVPLPPLAEQHRIVAKVDELMTICDQLEEQLNISQNKSSKLLEAVLAS